MAAPFRSDRSWAFAVPPAALWERIAATHEYPTWWPWLRSFDGGAGLRPGARWSAEVAPPLPYVVRFRLDFVEVEPHERAETRVEGDIRGWARLTVEPTDDGCRARLVSRLEPANPLLRAVGRMARPLVEWGHDWVLDEGRRQFVRRTALP